MEFFKHLSCHPPRHTLNFCLLLRAWILIWERKGKKKKEKEEKEKQRKGKGKEKKEEKKKWEEHMVWGPSELMATTVSMAST